MIHESIRWFERARESFSESGFRYVQQHRLPEQCWWTDYGAPLRERIRALRAAGSVVTDCRELQRYEAEVAWIAAHPADAECAFFFLRK